jgi:hypothetical protein
LKKIDDRMPELQEAKERVIDIYASGDLERAAYVERCLSYYNEMSSTSPRSCRTSGRWPCASSGRYRSPPARE